MFFAYPLCLVDLLYWERVVKIKCLVELVIRQKLEVRGENMFRLSSRGGRTELYKILILERTKNIFFAK